MPTINLLPEHRAAIIAGASTIELPEPNTAPAASGTPPVTAPVAGAPAAAPAAPAAPAANADVVAYLTAQLAEKDKSIVDLRVELGTLKANSESAAEALPGLLAIAQGAIGHMQVALGSADTSAALSAKDAIAEHAKIQAVYKARLPIGGVILPTPEGDEKPTGNAAFDERLATIRK